MDRLDQSKVPEEVQREFDDSLDADIENWSEAVKKSVEVYEKRTSGETE